MTVSKNGTADYSTVGQYANTELKDGSNSTINEFMSSNLGLFDKTAVPSAAQPYMEDLKQILEDRRFPCFFARAAFAENELLYGVGDISTSLDPVVALFDAAVTAIEANIEQTIVLWLINVPSETLDEERAMTARILEHLMVNDDTEWPEGAPQDPTHPRWDFWYRDIDFVINVSTPNHHKRRSRNLGRAYTLVIQSRTSFDIVEQRSGTARPIIRRRVERYDQLPASPALGSHGEHAELDQFFLGDSNHDQATPLLTREQINRIVSSRVR